MLFRVTHNSGLTLINLANVEWIQQGYDESADSLYQVFLNVRFVGSPPGVEKFYIDEDTMRRFDAIWNGAK